MIRKVVATICFGMIFLGSKAQHMQSRMNTYSDEVAPTGFSKENLFVGGGLGLGIGSYSFNVGAFPEVGYSVASWLDVGIVGNFNYTSQKDLYYSNLRTKTFSYGGGVFGRAYVLPFLFLTAQPEINWISQKLKDNNSGQILDRYNANAGSVLVGLGYGQRVVGQSNFYIALMFDVAQNKNSPYNDVNGHPLPVIRAGFDVFVHKK
ncbi:MAG: hypothetical protein JST68_24840 [Bacteroidetes bacterium]|nr:hypothetical protein [Bacteroidota bacterium]